MMTKIWKRVRQFARSLVANMGPSDHQWVGRYLNEAERNLFYAMAIPDQVHSVHVAHRVAELAHKHPAVERRVLIKTALLHDVGKSRGDMSLIDKSLAVLCYGLLPQLAHRMARYGRGGKIQNVRHALYLYKNHAARSATRAAAVGVTEDSCALIRAHHNPPCGDDSPELVLLRQADDEN